MDPKDRKQENEQQSNWEQDLADIQSDYSRLEADVPPALLDQAVLNTARRELADSRPRRLRWLGAFATATVVVLALTLVIQQDKQPVDSGRGDDVRISPDNQIEVRKKDVVGSSVEGKSEAAAMESDRERSLILKQSEVAERQDMPETEAPVESFAAPTPEPGGGFDELSADADFRDDQSVMSGPADRLESEVREQKSAARQGVRAAEEMNEEMTRAGQAADVSLPVVTTGAEKEPAGQDRIDSTVPRPEDWVEHMLNLLQNKQYEELAAELVDFREAYPDYPLPPELTN